MSDQIKKIRADAQELRKKAIDNEEKADALDTAAELLEQQQEQAQEEPGRPEMGEDAGGPPPMRGRRLGRRQ